MAGEVVRDADRVEDLAQPVLDASGPVAWIVSSAFVSRMISSVLTAAAAATRLPAYVPPWLTLSGRTLMTSARPPKAAAG